MEIRRILVVALILVGTAHDSRSLADTWQVYTNEVFRFSVKYPPIEDLRIVEKRAGLGPPVARKPWHRLAPALEVIFRDEQKHYFSVRLFTNRRGLELEELAYRVITMDGTMYREDEVGVATIKVGGEDGLILTYWDKEAERSLSQVFVPHKWWVYQVEPVHAEPFLLRLLQSFEFPE